MERGSSAPSLLASFVVEFLVLCLVGAVVAVVLALFTEQGYLRSIDRHLSDLLMQQLARQRLSSPPPRVPRLVYVDISQETCEIWARPSSCTLNMTTPRRELANLVRNLVGKIASGRVGPRLVVIDIELAPLAGGDGPTSSDEQLCMSIVELATHVPVIALPAIAFQRRGDATSIKAFPSILSSQPTVARSCPSGLATYGQAAANLWFASSLIEQDPDGVVRSVHAWDTFLDARANHQERIAGIGFLAAALLHPASSRSALACIFPGSRAEMQGCTDRTITVAGRTYNVDEGLRVDRILFQLPYQLGGIASRKFGYAPAVIQTIDARKLSTMDVDLSDAAVIIGGSYLASGDLHVTPLGADMPGAMIHANSIRAYATPDGGGLVDEKELFTSWRSMRLEASLIATAALIGALFHIVGVVARRRYGRWILLPILVAGTLVIVALVLSVAIFRASSDLAESGAVLATLTPSLAIAFEGISGVLHEFREILHHGLLRLRLR